MQSTNRASAQIVAAKQADTTPACRLVLTRHAVRPIVDDGRALLDPHKIDQAAKATSLAGLQRLLRIEKINGLR
ncbi:hypothetical protein [Dyella silvatica]|uniref:hypothetical protein n=1 Tax=Dyella silvatica TaxID=2992128 RepID=UPI0022579851|nr:hypothetical protein [Dyella silvatica]